MSQDYPDCLLEYVLGKEFLPVFALESKRLAHMRVYQKWYLRVAKLDLEAMLMYCPTNGIYNTDVEFLNLSICFEDMQQLFL
jgi:hypothetical protein